MSDMLASNVTSVCSPFWSSGLAMHYDTFFLHRKFWPLLTDNQCNVREKKKGCGYTTGTGTQVRVPAPYICMRSSHTCAIVLVALSRSQCHRRASTPNGKNLNPIATFKS